MIKRKAIRITPEMIEAGIEALCEADDRFIYKANVDLEQIVASVFSAMCSSGRPFCRALPKRRSGEQ